jgi:hypothetical protein
MLHNGQIDLVLRPCVIEYPMAKVIEFESLGSADLIVDAVYEGKDKQLASDPIARLLPLRKYGRFPDGR